MGSIVLFDGVCNLCSNSVQFILKRDPDGHFSFASLQGREGRKLVKKFQIAPGTDSLVLIENGQCFVKSGAALRICKHLKGAWKLFILLLLVPAPIRDFGYDIVARNRYKWFGRTESCMLPSKEWKERFLD